MLVVKILGPGCANCRKLEAVAREAVAADGAVSVEETTDEDRTVGLRDDRVDVGVNASGRDKGGVEGAGGKQASEALGRGAVVGVEGATDEDFAVGLDVGGVDRKVGSRAGVEGGVGRAIGVEHGHAVARETGGGGVSRDAGVDHPRPHALLRQGPLQGWREALRGLEAVAREQAVAKGHDKGALEARLRRGRLLCPGGLPGGGTGEDKLAKPGHDHI